MTVIANRDFVCVERVNDNPVAIHIVHKPTPVQNGFYRQTCSFDAFRRRQVNLVHKCFQKRIPIPRWFYCEFKADWEFMYEHNKKTLTELTGKSWDEFAGVPRIEHDNVWTFYKAIGYDYKIKKFVGNTINAKSN